MAQPNPPGDIQELLQRSPLATFRVVLAALPPDWETPVCYTREHVFDPDSLGRALGFSDFTTGRVNLQPGFQIHVQKLLGSTTGEPLDGYRLHRALQWLLVGFHEEIHGIGPADVAVALKTSVGYSRHAHTNAAVEGTTELAAERFAPQYFQRLGLTQIDSRLTDRALIETGGAGIYDQQKAAMALITDFAARTLVGFPQGWSHTKKVDAVIARLICGGLGDLSMGRLYDDIARGAGADLLEPRRLGQEIRDIAEPLDQALAYARTQWGVTRSTEPTVDVTTKAILKVERRCQAIRHAVEYRVASGERLGLPYPSSHMSRQTPAPSLEVRRTASGRRIVVSPSTLS